MTQAKTKTLHYLFSYSEGVVTILCAVKGGDYIPLAHRFFKSDGSFQHLHSNLSWAQKWIDKMKLNRASNNESLSESEWIEAIEGNTYDISEVV